MIADSASAVWLAGLLARETPDGRPEFSDLEIQDFLAVIVLGGVPGLEAVADQLTPHIEAFCERAELDGSLSPDEFQDRIAQYFETHPLNPKLLAAFHHEARTDRAVRGTVDMDSETLARIGLSARTFVQRSPSVPDGAVQGGPLAGFLSHRTIPKKSR